MTKRAKTTAGGGKGKAKARAKAARYLPPLTVSHGDLLVDGQDRAFRQTLYKMVTTFGRLQSMREAFGRAIDLTSSQFAVLIGVAYTQGESGVTIRQLADHVQLASTHVTTEVGRMCRMGLLIKHDNAEDGRSVLVCLTVQGEQRLDAVAPLVRRTNDILFANVDRSAFARLDAFLTLFDGNTARALNELRRPAGGKPLKG